MPVNKQLIRACGCPHRLEPCCAAFSKRAFVVLKLKRFEDRLVLKVFTVSFRPELIGYRTVGAEHHDPAFAWVLISSPVLQTGSMTE